ncbi:N-acetylmuramoyl-L-alanine amidase [Paenibacillus sp. J5C_2022]|uniref:N-acetylmuramoyl-L-alanine amidase n=1 Tax=Paenibacillus sp. J5C2022 TaxID=2977129 RepID=UPI0021D19C8F|nr:N-acetylmuramoyl-L-alanine amidase [Paenibacillus sp. J5C2022]MCU6709372.1 N-acetylmuramoyl-L-alanine amidase [Paenibacillus sp. J5C2022]
MSLEITKIRVYVSGNNVVRCDGNYAKRATDLRYVVIPVSEYDITAVGRTRAKTTDLAKEAKAEIAINFPYFNGTDGALIGQAIAEGRPLSYETAKTRGRAELYGVGGSYGIALSPPAAVDFAVQGSPELLRDGAVVVAESIKRDNLGISAADRSQRTAVGIRPNGDVVFVVSDGRTSYDLGLTFAELALVFRDELGCINAINGDGGGSSILYVGGSVKAAVNQASNRNNERGTGCALVVTKKTVPPSKPSDNLRIAIDAGHGLNTAGKRCPDDSMREFHFNSVVARYVSEELAKYEGVTVRFMHDETGRRDVPLSERVSTANDWGADTYVSIHANAYGSSWNDANGIETFTSVGASATSRKLAAAVQKELVELTGRRDRSVKRADFYVLYRTKMPAILVESGFMSNREEAALLKSDGYRRKVAAAIVKGLADTYGLAPITPDPSEPGSPAVETWEATLSSVNVEIEGQTLASGHIIDGVSYVPARAIAEALDASVRWDDDTRTVTITK